MLKYPLFVFELCSFDLVPECTEHHLTPAERALLCVCSVFTTKHLNKLRTVNVISRRLHGDSKFDCPVSASEFS